MADRRIDPYTAFNFRVEIDGITSTFFSEVTGLQIETEVEPYEEGGVNDFVHQLPKRTKYQNITLKRGIADLDDLWKWYQTIVKGTFKKGKFIGKNIHIYLLDKHKGEDKWAWQLENAYPVKWTGPTFNANNNSVAFESIELVYHGISKG